MEEPKKVSGLLIALIAFAVILIGYAITLNASFDKEHGSTGTTQTEGKDNDMLSDSEAKEAKEQLGNFESVVLTKNTGSKNDSYSYELGYKKDTLVFSCSYYRNGEEIVIKDKEVGTSRMSEVKEIIGRYTVATVIRQYRKDAKSVEIDNSGDTALEITWVEGDYINLGYPNGAGPALKKYFEKLANWMVEEEN